MPAEIVDAAFVANLHTFLGFDARADAATTDDTSAGALVDGMEVLADQLRRGITDALARGDQDAADELVDQLASHRAWIAANRSYAPSLGDLQRTAHEILTEFYAWSSSDLASCERAETERTVRLNTVLHGWFDRVEILRTPSEITILPILAPAPTARFEHPGELRRPPEPEILRVRQLDWMIALRNAGVRHQRMTPWEDDEILYALRRWSSAHGRSPRYSEWITAGPDHPGSGIVTRHLGPWRSVLTRAGLPPPPDLRRNPAQRFIGGLEDVRAAS